MNPPRKAGFTVLELLVIMAVVTVLIALLLPSIASLREAGEGARCASNLRIIGNAFHRFAAEHNNRMPGVRPWGASTSPWVTEHGHSDGFWADFIEREVDLRIWRDLTCPTHNRLLPADAPAINHLLHYGMNGAGFRNPFWLLHGVEQPSKGFLAGEVGVAGPGSRARITPLEVEHEPSKMGFIHGGRANILFVDGSSRALAPDEIPRYEARLAGHPDRGAYLNFWMPYAGTEVYDGPTHPR